MPCNAVSTIQVQLEMPLKDLVAWPGALDAMSALLGGQNLNWNGNVLATNGASLNVNGQANGYDAQRLVAVVKQVSDVITQLKAIQAIKEILAVQSELGVGNTTVLTVEL